MTVERSIFSISEEKVTGRSVVSSNDVPKVRVEMTNVAPGVRQYSVEGFVPLERQAISTLLQLPINSEDGAWSDVQQDLYDVSYPDNRVEALTRSAGIFRKRYNKQDPANDLQTVISSTKPAEMRAHWQDVKGAARELADILSNNQDYRTQSANLPVFKYGEAQEYATQELYTKIPEERLIAMIKSFRITEEERARLNATVGWILQTPEAIRELELLTGIDNSVRSSDRVEIILEAINGKILDEIVERLRDNLFTGYPELSKVVEGRLEGGTDDLKQYIRREDLPALAHSGHTSLIVGGSLDKDRKSGLDRNRVTFVTQVQRHVTLPKLTWNTTDDGRRSLAFPLNTFQKHPTDIIRPSSLAGAALAASSIGKELGIDYRGALDKLILHNAERQMASRSIAGLWPLVAIYQQRELLAHPYFEDMENQL